ncbi:MAG TPA: hypothetical protein VM661_13140 [Candidatus Sulfotelmatobacter sp.]|nr:hypothetical protein [Candidatus Sulfotelmatobacter sp.]
MSALFYTPLSHRALIKVGGDDRKDFLQGLVSADVPRADGSRGLYGAFLTPQGKFLNELFLAEQTEILWLETEAARRAEFVKKLSMYKLRAKVTVAADDSRTVFALWGDGAAQALVLAADAGAFGGGLALKDPRLADAGFRAWLPEGGEAALQAAGFTRADVTAWDERRIALGLPDGSRDLEPEKALLLENGFDELYGVDFKKGCYMGQELTARTKYRALIKKRLLPVRISGAVPETGTPVLLGEAEAGELRSHCGQSGLALLRLEQLAEWREKGGTLRCGDAALTPSVPDWVVLPA